MNKRTFSTVIIIMILIVGLCSCTETLKIRKTGTEIDDVKTYARALAEQLCDGYSENWFVQWRGSYALFDGKQCYVIDVEDELGNIVCNIAVSPNLKRCFIDYGVNGIYQVINIKNGTATAGTEYTDSDEFWDSRESSTGA